MRLGSCGCTRIECRHSPPNPGFHFGRSGWLNSASFSRNVSPRSSERNIAAGSTPASTTSGPSGASSAQIALSDTPLPLGNLILPSVGSVHVAPKSSDRLTIAPQCSLLLPIRIRGEPPSMKAADQADCPGKCGPDILKSPRVRSLRKMNAPLTVPTISRRSPDRGESFAVVLMIASSRRTESSIAWYTEVKKATSPGTRQDAPASWSIRRDANRAPGLIRKAPDAGSVWSFRLDLQMLPSTAFQVGSRYLPHPSRRRCKLVASARRPRDTHLAAKGQRRLLSAGGTDRSRRFGDPS